VRRRSGVEPALVLGPSLPSLVALLALVAVPGCGTGPEPVDVDLELELPERLAVGQPLRIGYRWSTGPGWTPGPANVFVHIRSVDGRLLVQGDHRPPRPPGGWQAGEEIVYERWLHHPEIYDHDTVELRVGLYGDGGELAMVDPSGDGSTGEIRRIHVDRHDHRGVAMRMEGWHPTVLRPGADLPPFAWTTDRAVTGFRNPRGDARLHLLALGPTRQVGPQRIEVAVNFMPVAEFEIEGPGRFHRAWDVPAALLGDGSVIEVELRVAPTFVPHELDPGSPDRRTLGLRVSSLYLERRAP